MKPLIFYNELFDIIAEIRWDFLQGQYVFDSVLEDRFENPNSLKEIILRGHFMNTGLNGLDFVLIGEL